MVRLSNCHKIYTIIISDQQVYPKEMREATNKYMLAVSFFQRKNCLLPLCNQELQNVQICSPKIPQLTLIYLQTDLKNFF